MKIRYLAPAIASLLLCAIPINAQAQNSGDPVPELQDLVGLRGSSGESALTQRGYQYRRAEQSGNTSYTYWTNTKTKQCITVRTEDGNYASLAYAPMSDCNGDNANSNTSSSANAGDSVDELQDLIGMRGSSGESALKQRGYQYRWTEKSGNMSYSYWTNTSTSQCITVRTEDGTYASIAYATTGDCDRGSANSNNTSSSTSVSSNRIKRAGTSVPALTDLVGMEAAEAEPMVMERGYTFERDGRANSGFAFWRESGTNYCVTIITKNRRYDRIVYSNPGDCR